MSVIEIQAYGDCKCSICGKQIYREVRTEDGDKKIQYALWCPTRGCWNNRGDYCDSIEKAVGTIQHSGDSKE